MNNGPDQTKTLEAAPSAADYALLREVLGWTAYPVEHISQALQGSLYCVCVYEKNLIIGMGRIVGDSCLCFYIQDVMVVPDRQGKGVGGIIMSHIMNYLHEHATEDAYIGLMCSKGKSRFYERYGFIARPNEDMGPGMVIRNFRPAISKL